MEGLQVEGTQPTPRWRSVLGAQASAALGLLPPTSGSAPPACCGTPENRMVPRPGAAACPLLGAPGTPARALGPGSTQQRKETEQSSAAWTALGTAQTQPWPGHQDYLSPLTKSTMGVLASTWKAIRDRQEETSHQEGRLLLLLSICFWEALP